MRAKSDPLSLPMQTLVAPPTSPDTLGDLTRRLTQVMRRSAGRGPGVARCHWAGPDVLLALFADGSTKVEETLLRHGEDQVALNYRRALQEALENEMKAEVERATGRSVITVMSCARFEPDLVAEIFLLKPGGPGAAEAGPRGAGNTPAPRPVFDGNGDGTALLDGAGPSERAD